MPVRAKFKCEKCSPENGGDYPTIRLSAVINGSNENEEFFRYTPSGTITLGLANVETAKHFQEGQEYYVDFTPASP